MEKKINTILLNVGLKKIRTLRELEGGKWGNKFLIDDDLIVKLNPNDSDEFSKENFILSRFQTLPVPRLIKYDNSRTLIPEEYIIESRLEGTNLSLVWPDMNEEEREGIFKDLIRILKQFHKTRFDFYGDFVDKSKRYAKWSDFIEDRYNTNKRLAREMKILDEKDFSIIHDFYLQNKEYLTSEIRPCFCHGDVHFNNILVAGGKITGILDFDLSQAAPLDYEFDLPICFFRQPTFFLDDKLNNRYTKPLKKCEIWLRKYYPSLFEISHIKERLGLYSVLSDLKMLWLCKPFGYGDDVKKIIKNRILETVKNGFRL